MIVVRACQPEVTVTTVARSGTCCRETEEHAGHSRAEPVVEPTPSRLRTARSRAPQSRHDQLPDPRSAARPDHLWGARTGRPDAVRAGVVRPVPGRSHL